MYSTIAKKNLILTLSENKWTNFWFFIFASTNYDEQSNERKWTANVTFIKQFFLLSFVRWIFVRVCCIRCNNKIDTWKTRFFVCCLCSLHRNHSERILNFQIYSVEFACVHYCSWQRAMVAAMRALNLALKASRWLGTQRSGNALQTKKKWLQKCWWSCQTYAMNRRRALNRM